jgi:hypothetical protein
LKNISGRKIKFSTTDFNHSAILSGFAVKNSAEKISVVRRGGCAEENHEAKAGQCAGAAWFSCLPKQWPVRSRQTLDFFC